MHCFCLIRFLFYSMWEYDICALYKHTKPVCTQTDSYGMIKRKIIFDIYFFVCTHYFKGIQAFCTYLATMIRLCAAAAAVFFVFAEYVNSGVEWVFTMRLTFATTSISNT